MKEVDNIVKSWDEFTFEEGESKDMQKKQPQDYVSVDIVDNKSLPHLPHGFLQKMSNMRWSGPHRLYVNEVLRIRASMVRIHLYL